MRAFVVRPEIVFFALATVALPLGATAGEPAQAPAALPAAVAGSAVVQTAPARALAAEPQAPAPTLQDAARAKRAVGALINAIRYDKRALGAKRIAFSVMAQDLLGADYQSLSAAERAQFVGDFQALLVATAFPKGHDLFQYLDGVLYGEVRKQGDKLLLPSTIVVHRSLKKTEIPVEWVVAYEDGQPKVCDIVSMGESTCQAIREEEVMPLIKGGGTKALLAALGERAAAARRAPVAGAAARP